MRELESDAPKYLTDAVRRLEGLDVGRRLVLLVLIPVQFPKERELAGQVANGFQVAVGQPEDAVGLHERHGGEDVIGDIAGAVDDHIGGDLTQAADEFLRLLLGAGCVGILVFPLAQPQHGQVGQLLVGGQVVLDEIHGDSLGGEDAAQGFVALQLRGRADAGHHGGGHIAEQQRHILFLGRQMLCDLHRSHGLTAAGTSPDGKDSAAGFLDDFNLLRLCAAVKQASFHEVHSAAASLSATESAPSLSPVSVFSVVSAFSSASGSAYSSSIRASCASMNAEAFSGVPR